MKPKISVVIGTYNQCGVLRLALQGMLNQTLGLDDYEVIVVDSSSDDGTDKMAEEFLDFRNFRYIRQENKGKSGARNRGIMEAISDIIYITDADIVPAADLLEKHLAFHKAHPGCSAEGNEYNLPTLDNKKLLEYIEAGKANAPIDVDKLENAVSISVKLHKNGQLRWYNFLTGNVSFSRAKAIELGLFDCDFQGYGWEDLEFGYRFEKAGVPLYYLEDARNYHFHPISNEGEIERHYRMGMSAAVFAKKHPELKWFLNVNPVSFTIHGLLNRMPSMVKKLERDYEQSSFAKWLLKEYKYVSGAKEVVSK